MKSVSITTNVVAMCTDTTLIYVIKFTVYIHNDFFPIKSAFLPPFRIRKRFHSDFLFIFTTDGEIEIRSYVISQRTKNMCCISTQHQEEKFQKRDVSRVTVSDRERFFTKWAHGPFLKISMGHSEN